MSCGAFGGSGNCGGGAVGGGGVGGGGGGGGALGGYSKPRQCADRGFFDPFCMPPENKRCEPGCYFNPFVHAQCLGVDMNMEGFRNDIEKCQEDYKKAVWAVLKKYAVGEAAKANNNANNMMGGFSNKDLVNMSREAANRMNNNNFRRSSSSGFKYDDPRNRRNHPNGRPMQT